MVDDLDSILAIWDKLITKFSPTMVKDLDVILDKLIVIFFRENFRDHPHFLHKHLWLPSLASTPFAQVIYFLPHLCVPNPKKVTGSLVSHYFTSNNCWCLITFYIHFSSFSVIYSKLSMEFFLHFLFIFHDPPQHRFRKLFPDPPLVNT